MLVPYHQIRLRLQWQMRQIVIAALGGALLAVGGGFLVSAGWLILAEEFSPLIASFACGAILCGLGLIVLAFRGRGAPVIPTLDQQLRAQSARGEGYRPKGDFPALMEAFLFGVSIYAQIKNRKK
ncbi:MAG: hypothetical protein EA338_06035 [Roseinatronobacter sp.]|nr:MAG: hypothetical protein EA338_06035 [Roseinatronobacter sp.]